MTVETENAGTSARPEPARRFRRHIGAHRGERPGPLLLGVAGLHGNEPAGIHALDRVLRVLAAASPRFLGDLVGVSGNLGALERGERFIDEDMNRVWQKDRVASILAAIRAEEAGAEDADAAARMVGSAELREQRELLEAIRREARGARGPVYVLDLHTTSSKSAPFTTLGDTLQNRRLALQLPVPAVLGLEEQIDGAMLQYFDRLGWAGIGIEGGAHDDPASVNAHEAAIWILLHALGMIEGASPAAADECWRHLADATRDLPRVVDVRYRHAIDETDGFRMEPGFCNFDRVRKGQRLGTDRRGPVRAPLSGLLFLPLYQRQGDDGFFVVRPLQPVWLAISRWLRRRGFDRHVGWIPGVIRHPERADMVILAPWARNRVTIGILHLLGFNVRREPGRVVMVRRVERAREGGPLDLAS